MVKKKVVDDLGASQAQEIVDEENAQGFRGVEVDPTPNENYTVAGVIEGAPTPETDTDAAKAAREASGLDPFAQPEGPQGEMVKVKNADGKSFEMSRKAYNLQSDKFTLAGGKD